MHHIFLRQMLSTISFVNFRCLFPTTFGARHPIFKLKTQKNSNLENLGKCIIYTVRWDYQRDYSYR